MADTVATHVLLNSGHDYIVKLMGISDGTGEAAVQKVDISGINNDHGVVCTVFRLKKIKWAITGYSVRLIWDSSGTDTLACVLRGTGEIDFSDTGDYYVTTTGTGDLLLTTPAGDATGTYDITIEAFKD